MAWSKSQGYVQYVVIKRADGVWVYNSVSLSYLHHAKYLYSLRNLS